MVAGEAASGGEALLRREGAIPVAVGEGRARGWGTGAGATGRSRVGRSAITSRLRRRRAGLRIRLEKEGPRPLLLQQRFYGRDQSRRGAPTAARRGGLPAAPAALAAPGPPSRVSLSCEHLAI